MRHFGPYSLWLGHAGDLRDLSQVLESDVQAIVQLALEEPAPKITRDVTFLRIPLDDGAENPAWKLRLAVETVAHLLAADIPTLVGCGAGLSRSPAIAACALASLDRRSPATWLAEMRDSLPIDVSPGLWQSLLVRRG